MEIFNQRVKIKPENATAWRYMAEVLMNLGRWEEGLQGPEQDNRDRSWEPRSLGTERRVSHFDEQDQ